MKVKGVIKLVSKALKDNTVWLVPVGTGAGVLSTAYLTARATVKAVRIVDTIEGNEQIEQERIDLIKDRVGLCWKYYVPPAVTGALTVGLVTAGSKSLNKKALAAASVASSLETVFTEYKKQVVNQIGENKERDIRDKVAKKQLEEKPISKSNVILIDGKEVVCFERYTGRYFKSDIDTLKRAQNDINAMILSELYVTLSEFYELIGLDATSTSGEVGWDSDKLLELEFSTMLSDDGSPCLTFGYNYVKTI